MFVLFVLTVISVLCIACVFCMPYVFVCVIYSMCVMDIM